MPELVGDQVASRTITIVQGDAYLHVVRRYTRVNDANVDDDISALEVSMGIRHQDSGDDLVVAESYRITGEDGTVVFRFTPEQTATLTPRVRYRFYVRDDTNDRTWIRGRVLVEAQA